MKKTKNRKIVAESDPPRTALVVEQPGGPLVVRERIFEPVAVAVGFGLVGPQICQGLETLWQQCRILGTVRATREKQ
jgi:hypothetical protein